MAHICITITNCLKTFDGKLNSKAPIVSNRQMGIART